MNNGDLLDIAAGVAILLILTAWWFIKDWERARIDKLRDNSVGEKYMQLMAAFMKVEGARLIDMSPNRADMRVKDDEGGEENLSIVQSEKEVNIYWSLKKGEKNFNREFQFKDKETQEQMMEIIASEISEAKKEV